MTRDEAVKMRDLLNTLANEATVRQVRYEMRRRHKEYRRAVDDFDLCDGEGAIELVGSVSPGMEIVGGEFEEWQAVVRSWPSNGGWTIHVDEMGRAVYRNFHDATSPVVVRR